MLKNFFEKKKLAAASYANFNNTYEGKKIILMIFIGAFKHFREKKLPTNLKKISHDQKLKKMVHMVSENWSDLDPQPSGGCHKYCMSRK